MDLQVSRHARGAKVPNLLRRNGHVPGSATADRLLVSLWRYPVKSMMGEELNAAVVDERGLLAVAPTLYWTARTGRWRAPRTRVSGLGCSTFASASPAPCPRRADATGPDHAARRVPRHQPASRRRSSAIARVRTRGNAAASQPEPRAGRRVDVPQPVGNPRREVPAGHGRPRLPGHRDRLRAARGNVL
jgi:hypothetical protein